MSAFEDLENAIKRARNSCEKFSTEHLTGNLNDRIVNMAFTAAEAIHMFEDLLRSVETSMENPQEVKRHIASGEMNSVTQAIKSLSRNFLSKDYSSFVSNLDGSIAHFRPFVMLSMEKMDNKRYKDVSSIGTILQEMEMQTAKTKTIIKEISQRNKHLEEVIYNHNHQVMELDASLPTARANIVKIQKLHDDAVDKSSEITTAAAEAQKTKGQLTVYESQAESKNSELEGMLKQGEISIQEQTKTAKNMIISAEQALHLSAAEGLSAAFSAKARDLGCKKTKTFWLSLGIVSIIAAIVIGWFHTTARILADWYIMLPRFVLIGILLGLSAFALRQYSKNKSLEYDYDFKSALVGSYPGISAQLDETTRKEYASKLIIEILQDPQRTRARKITTPASGIGK